MSKVCVLVGTRKGAFVMTSDERRRDWKVEGPHFAGWDVYQMNGSPADPDRLYAAQSRGWFGQGGRRSAAGGETGHPGGNAFKCKGSGGARSGHTTPNPPNKT